MRTQVRLKHGHVRKCATVAAAYTFWKTSGGVIRRHRSSLGKCVLFVASLGSRRAPQPAHSVGSHFLPTDIALSSNAFVVPSTLKTTVKKDDQVGV